MVANIYTSTNSGGAWTERTGAGSRNWTSIASSSTGTNLAACVNGGWIYTSTDSGANWIEREDIARNWTSIASSSDGATLAAVVTDGYIYISTDYGVTWTAQTGAGSRSWNAIAASSDGVKLAAVVIGGSIWTGTLDPNGALQVSLIPPEAITAGARWQVDGGEWRNSGATVTGLSVGEHAIAYKSVTDWISPGNETVTIVKDQTATVAGTYVQMVKGDVNGDGQVDLADAILSLQVLSGLVPDYINPVADVNSDTKIGMAEAIHAMQKTAGL